MIRHLNIFLLFTFIFPLICQAGNNSPVGLWWVEEKDSKIEIFEENGKLFGKIAWMKEQFNPDGSEKIDHRNPDSSLKDQPIQDLVFIFDLKKEEDKWVGGTLYNPQDGRTYQCSIQMLENGQLKLHGYIGMPLLGRSVVWDPVENR